MGVLLRAKMPRKLPAVIIGTQNLKLDFVKGTIRVSPEVAVKGNGSSIVNNDSTPSIADWTNFGATAVNGGTLTRQFTIHNLGNASLNLSGMPRVSIGGAQATEFVVTAQPVASIIGNGSATFTVRFDPSDAGTRTAKISFANNDGNENPFSFAISGNGTLQSQSLVFVQALPVGNPNISAMIHSVGGGGRHHLEQTPAAVKVDYRDVSTNNLKSNSIKLVNLCRDSRSSCSEPSSMLCDGQWQPAFDEWQASDW